MNTILVLETYDLTCPSNRMSLEEDMGEFEYYNIPFIRENHYNDNYVLILFEV